MKKGYPTVLKLPNERFLMNGNPMEVYDFKTQKTQELANKEIGYHIIELPGGRIFFDGDTHYGELDSKTLQVIKRYKYPINWFNKTRINPNCLFTSPEGELYALTTISQVFKKSKSQGQYQGQYEKDKNTYIYKYSE